MTNPRIVVVNSTIAQTAAVEEDSKTQMIFDCNHLTLDRTSVYAQEGYDEVPVGTKLRTALDAAFLPDLKPAIVRVGRLKGTSIYSPTAVASGKEFGLTITVADGYSLEATATTGVGEDAEDVLTDIAALFNADVDITDHVAVAVSGTGAAAVLLINLVSTTDDYSISGFTGDYTISSIPTEAPTTAIADILDFNSDWVFATCTHHIATYQASFSAAMQPIADKYFITSSNNAENYATWDGVTAPSTSNLAAVVKFNNYTKTHVAYHHLADNFYECMFVSLYSQKPAGSVNWQFKTPPSFPLALNFEQTRALNVAELLNLQEVYASTVIKQGGLVFTGGYEGSGNRFSDGIRIEAKHWTTYCSQQIRRRLITLIANKDKIGMNIFDFNTIKNLIETFLKTQVSTVGTTYALNPIKPFVVTMPNPRDISFEDQVDGILQGIKITAYSDASVDSIITDLTVTFLAE